MASLVQATQATRKFLKWAGIALAIFLALRYILIPLGILVYNILFPSIPPAPLVEFGKLEKTTFPMSAPASSFTFTVGTTTGTLPPTCILDACVANKDPLAPVNIPDRVAVYKAAEITPSFLSYERVKNKITTVGFTGEGIPLSDTSYQWRHPKQEGRQITYDVLTNEFTLTSTTIPPTTDGETKPLPPVRDEAINIAVNFLSNLSLTPKDLDQSTAKGTFLKQQGDSFIPGTSQSESDVIQIDFYRKPLGELPIIYPHTNRSLISFRIIGRNNFEREFSILDATFSYKPVELNKSSTYPIKTAPQAFEELQAGKAYIAEIPSRSATKTIPIQRVYLGYFEGNKGDKFFKPVYVFEGQGGFRAIVEAVTDEWIL